MRSKKEDIIATVSAIALPVCKELGIELYDVDFYKEGADYNLCILIDKKGGVTIEDCEAVSRILDPLLDEADPIDVPYCLEVSSCGADRTLTRPAHYEGALGERVMLRFYTAQNGSKTAVGELKAYDADGVTLIAADGEMTFSFKDIAKANIDVDYDKLLSGSEN